MSIIKKVALLMLGEDGVEEIRKQVRSEVLDPSEHILAIGIQQFGNNLKYLVEYATEQLEVTKNPLKLRANISKVIRDKLDLSNTKIKNDKLLTEMLIELTLDTPEDTLMEDFKAGKWV